MGLQKDGPGQKVLEDAAEKVCASKPKHRYFLEKGLVDQFYQAEMIRT